MPKINNIALVMLLVSYASAFGTGTSVKKEVEKIAPLLNGDGASCIYALEQFKSDVKDEDQQEVIIGLLKKNLENVRSNSLLVVVVLSWLDHDKFKGITWDKRLQDAVVEHKNDPLPNVRNHILTLSRYFDDESHKRLICWGLTDPEEDVRMTALEILKMEGHTSDIQAYITNNIGKTEHIRSFEHAKWILQNPMIKLY